MIVTKLRSAVPWLAAALTAALLGTAPAASAAPAQPLRFHNFNVPGATATELFSINDKGFLTGIYTNGLGEHGFIQAGNRLTRFNYPGSSQTVASYLNNHGTVAGWYFSSTFHGYLRSPAGHFTSLNDPHAGTGRNQGTYASSVTDQGVVVGYYATSANIYHGFVYQSGRFTTVNVPHAFYGKPDWGTANFGVNDAGVIIGIYTPSRKNLLEGYVDTAGHFVSFIAPGAGTHSGDATEPEGISNAGTIAGVSIGTSGVYHGWLLAGQHYTLLNDPLASTTAANGQPAGTIPVDVNRQGVVVGGYFDTNHVEHGFIVDTGIHSAAADPRATPRTPSAPTQPQPPSIPRVPMIHRPGAPT